MIVCSVKQVLSGDTIIASGSGGATLSLTLTGLKAPRFPQQPRNNSVAADEPFGVESREFLRRLVMGHKIAFQIDHKDPANSEHVWVTLWLHNSTSSYALEDTVNAKVARAGWAKLKDLDLKQHPDLDSVLRRCSAECGQQQGLYQPPSQAKKIYWDFPGDFPLYANRLQEQRTARALVEYCRDACTFRMQLLDSQIMVWFTLAGIMGVRKPATNVITSESIVIQEDVLAAESKRFSEIRLLQREIVLDIGGFDPTNKMIYGNIIHPIGKCISQELVKHGMAKVVDWSIAFLPTGGDGAPTLRALQREAQQNQRGCWKDFVPKQASAAQADYEGVITEVLSGDTFLVRLAGKGEERRVSLSSVQAPKLAPRNSTEQQQGERFALDSKEFLRNKFQGSKVLVHVDYVREPTTTAGLPPRTFASVLVLPTKTINIGQEMVKQGLATVVSHRQDDDSRSLYYDDLLVAAAQAKHSKLGLFGTAQPMQRNRLQFGSDAQKSRTHLPHLTRQQQDLRCTVEWVASATRMGLDLPEENVLLTSFAIAGITVPLLANKRNVAQDEPFAREALEFCRSQLFTPGLRVRIESVDRMGGFLGSILVKGEFNLAYILLERGLAKVHVYSAENSKYKFELYAHEEKAKRARLGVWKDYVEQQPQQQEQQDEPEELRFRECTVTDLVSGDTVFCRYNSADSKRVDHELDGISTSLVPLANNVKKGQLVAARFHDGKEEKWYRAKVLAANSSSVRVLFVDYGNEDEIRDVANRLAALPSTLQTIPALAQEKRLAFCRAREHGQEYAREAALLLSDFCFEESDQLYACDTRFGLLLKNDRDELVNERLVHQGLCFLRQRDGPRVQTAALQEVFEQMKQAQKQARVRHRAMWQFGDPGDEDDE